MPLFHAIICKSSFHLTEAMRGSMGNHERCVVIISTWTVNHSEL